MQNQGVIMKCGRCQQPHRVGLLRYTSDGKTLVCRPCSELAGSPTKRTLAALPRKFFRCLSCGYRFRQGKMPTACPYCGKSSVAESDDITTSRLLLES